MCECMEFGGLTKCICQGESLPDPERPLELWDFEDADPDTERLYRRDLAELDAMDDEAALMDLLER